MATTGKPRMATEATPLVEAGPSLTLAMLRARLRLVRNPETDELFPFLGLVAPHSAFRALGMGCALHVKILGYCFYVAVIVTLLSFTVVLFPVDPSRDLEAGTAGAWMVLTYGHVAFDACLVCLFGAFILFIGYLLVDPYTFEEQSVLRKLAEFEERLLTYLAGAEREGQKKLQASIEAAAGGSEKLGAALERNAALARKLEKLGVRIGVSSQVPQAMVGEKRAIPSVGPVLEDAVRVEGCSLVVKGWGRGVQLPSEVYEAIVRVAGAEPTYAVQPTECVRYDEARAEASAARAKLEDAQTAERKQSNEGTAAAVAACKAEVDVTAANEESALQACMGKLLDYAFLTFQTSEQKSAVLLAAKDGTLLAQAGGDLAESSQPLDFGGVESAVSVHPAPNPRDVIWRSLEATDGERAYSHVVFTLSMVAIAVLFSAVMAMALTLGALLQCNSPFLGISDLLTDGDSQRLSYFLIMFGIVFTSVQLMIQPIFCVYADRGLFCNPRLRLMTCTYTSLFAKAGSFWMWIEFIILALVFLFHVFLTIRDQPGYSFALYLTNLTAMPDEEINFYFLCVHGIPTRAPYLARSLALPLQTTKSRARRYGAEVSGNLMLAALVEGFLCIWVLPTIGRWLVAPFQKTQEAMDRWCRMTDPAHLPFSTSDAMRVIASGTLWSGLFPHALPMLILYYTIALCVVRTNLLGRCEPGPPTKPLQYRFCFTFYLPLHLIGHIILCFGLYADVEVPDPQNFGSGLFPGFIFYNFCGTPQKLLHSLFCLCALLATTLVLPYCLHARCVREGVLTPYELFRFFFCSFMSDADFETSARASVGVHHLTTPAYFSPKGDEPTDEPGTSLRSPNSTSKTRSRRSPGDVMIELPDALDRGSLYQPICAIDLLKQEKKTLLGLLLGTGPSWLRD